MLIEEIMPSLRSGLTIYRKDKDKIIMMKFENDFIYKKFIYQGLMTDWAISSINNEDFISRWSVY